EAPDFFPISRALRVGAEESALPARRAPRPELFFKDSFVAMCVTEAEVSLAFELHSEERLDYPILQPPLEVEIRAADLRQPPFDERRFRTWLGAVAPEEARFVGVGATRETHVRAVISRPARHADEVTEVAT